jgi:hypothetical protein
VEASTSLPGDIPATHIREALLYRQLTFFYFVGCWILV